MKLVLATFKTQLEDFARAHSSEIKKNAVFRSHFQLLCSKVGVDPLASNKVKDCYMLAFNTGLVGVLDGIARVW